MSILPSLFAICSATSHMRFHIPADILQTTFGQLADAQVRKIGDESLDLEPIGVWAVREIEAVDGRACFGKFVSESYRRVRRLRR